MKRRSFLQAALGAIGLGKLAGDEILDSLRSEEEGPGCTFDDLELPKVDRTALIDISDFREATSLTFGDSSETFTWKNPQRR